MFYLNKGTDRTDKVDFYWKVILQIYILVMDRVMYPKIQVMEVIAKELLLDLSTKNQGNHKFNLAFKLLSFKSPRNIFLTVIAESVNVEYHPTLDNVFMALNAK